MAQSHVRLEGLDLARFFAFAGMVLVNFTIVMGAGANDGPLHWLSSVVEGKAAASFVVLAGIGVGLSARRSGHDTLAIVAKRAMFLLVLGLLNTLIFPADILHYYAFYFLFGVVLLSQKTRVLIALIVLLNVCFLVLVFTLNYDTGWNWQDYTYDDFWTPAGFVRNLIFNGWHPVVPWLGFFLFGIILSRMELGARRVQMSLAGIGAMVLIGTSVISSSLTGLVDPELAPLIATLPIPPGPLFTIVGVGAACVLVGLGLWTIDRIGTRGVAGVLVAAGRQSLTLYLAHIIIGMGVIEGLGLLGGQSATSAAIAALIFCAAACIYAALWQRVAQRGPLEALMRRVAG